MPTGYAKISENDKVMDVFYFIVACEGCADTDKGKWAPTVKCMVKVLKQPQSTISTKLQFLKDHKLIKKDKWVYSVNWLNTARLFKKEVEAVLDEYSTAYRIKEHPKFGKETELRIKEVAELFNEKRVKSILIHYSFEAVDETIFKKNATFREVFKTYLDGLDECDIPDKRRDLLKIKNVIGFKTMQRMFVELAEDIRNAK